MSSHERAELAALATALPLYEIQGEIGRGGWGIVLSARHRQLGRDVAVKQLPLAFGADPAVRARFLSEARVLASFEHPHIVPIYDFIEHDDLCVLVMERLGGGTVWSKAKRGGFTPPEACALVLAACAGLQYAHQRGVLHRDIKPENLMFSTSGVLKVTDFGLAKVVGGAATVSTRAGNVLGTPAYMAPEQAQGTELSPATDIYAIGTVLYQLLSGELPYPLDSSPIAMLYRHVHEPPRPLRDVAPTVPAALADVTARALERDPSRRYADAEEMAVALAEAAAGAWGERWLPDTGTTVTTTGPVLSAAVGQRQSRLAATLAPGFTPPIESPKQLTPPPADLVPIHSLQDLVRLTGGPSPPPVSPISPHAPPAPPPTVGPTMGAPAAEAPTEPTPPPAKGTARRRLALVAVAVVAAAALIAGALALTGGGDDDETTPTDAPLVAAWRTLGPAPTPRQQAAVAVDSGTIWLLGGLTPSGSTTSVEGYDPAISTWKPGPNLPLTLHDAMAVAYRGEIVVMGGWLPEGGRVHGRLSEKVFVLRQGHWMDLTPLRAPRASGTAVAIGQRIFVVGGVGRDGLEPKTEVFDGRGWSLGTDLPTPRSLLAGTTDGEHLFAIGGHDASGAPVGTVERYDPGAREWTALPNMPTPRIAPGAAVVKGRIVAAGGEAPTGVANSVELFDIAGSAWSSGPPLATARRAPAVAAVGSSVFALGGGLTTGPEQPSTVVEVLREE